jgi:hypothetical protein
MSVQCQKRCSDVTYCRLVPLMYQVPSPLLRGMNKTPRQPSTYPRSFDCGRWLSESRVTKFVNCEEDVIVDRHAAASR